MTSLVISKEEWLRDLFYASNPLSNNIYIVCTTKPSLNFGSNHVDLGGIISFASDMLIKSSTETGYIENATFAFPPSTNLSNSSVPLIPPIKSTLVSVRISSTPSIGWKI